jgi:hypothetical protein
MFEKCLLSIIGMVIGLAVLVAFANATNGPNPELCQNTLKQLKVKLSSEKRDALRRIYSEKCSYE